MGMQQLAKLKLAIATQLASKSDMQQTNLKYNSYLYKQQMMPRLTGCLFKFIQKQPTDTRGVYSIGRQVAIQFISDRCKKTENRKGFLRNFSQNSQGNTCVIASFSNFIKRNFCRDFFKIDFGTCFPVNFAKFLGTPFSQLLACRLGDCCFFLLIFISPWFHLFVASQLQVPYIYSVSLFYNLTNFYDSCSYLSSLLFLLPKTEFVSSFAFVLCSPFLPNERCQTVIDRKM